MATGFGKVQVEEGGEWTPPEVDDGVYKAIVDNVEDRFGTPSYDGKGTQDQYMVTYKLTELEDDDDGDVTLVQFLNVPPSLKNDGVLYEDSNIYKAMEAFGFNMEKPVVDPDDWIGKECQVLVENKAAQSGKNKGVKRPKITSVLAPKQDRRRRRARQEEDDGDDY